MRNGSFVLDPVWAWSVAPLCHAKAFLVSIVSGELSQGSIGPRAGDAEMPAVCVTQGLTSSV
jgi:hypothetical protein